MYFYRFIDSNHAKDIPEALQVSILMKGLQSELLSLVMSKNPQTLEEMRQAMVLAEQTTSASKTESVTAVSHEKNVHMVAYDCHPIDEIVRLFFFFYVDLHSLV